MGCCGGLLFCFRSKFIFPIRFSRLSEFTNPLNDLTHQVYRLSTKRMEGNFASGSTLLAEYLRVSETLQQIHDSSIFTSIVSMIDVMLPKLAQYQQEAASAQIVLMATVLNPRYRLKLFDLHYAEYADRAKGGIQCIFNKAVEDWPATPEVTPPPNSSQPSRDHFDHFDIFTAEISSDNSAKIRAAELDRYLQGIDPILPGQSELSWWKVRFFFFVESFSIRI